MILRYTLPDGFGNYLTLTVQGATRRECDSVAQAEVDGAKENYGVFKLQDAEVVDLTDEPVLRSTYYNHEIGEDTVLV